MEPLVRKRVAAGLTSLLVLLGGCSVGGTAPSATPSVVVSSAATGSVFDASVVHSISVEVDAEALKKMIQTYLDSGEKEWIKASVTIDGQTFTDVGIKLKGNSSLRSITTATPAQELPLRIRLDKYVDGQAIDGFADFTVRSNSTATSLNEAVSLDLLRTAGLASERAIATRFSVNGGDAALRLTVQNLDDAWVAENFPDAGADSVLYKSEADGNWSWRGEDGDYTTSFEIEAGEDDYAPLIKLLDLVNNGSAEEIAEQLPDLLDVDSLAQYLAFQEFVDNFDDIDGPGNNSYLFWDSASGTFTVVAWDHNLTFGARNVGGGGGGGGAGGGRPGGAQPTAAPGSGAGQAPANPGGGGGRGMSRANPLTDAFKANSEWSALYETKLAALKETLIASGALTTSLDAWVATLTVGASDLVPAATITSEADAIRSYAK